VAGLDAPQLVFFVILAVAFVLLLTERLRNDVVAILIVLALAVSGLLKPEKALSGFGSEPAIVVAAIFVLSAALHSPEPSVVTLAMASVVVFLTPIGHHGNLLVYGPGGYRFGDFVRVGAPLTLICAAIVVLLAPMLWRG